MHLEQQNNWLSTTLGQYLLSHEQAMYDRKVGDIFGFNAVQLGLPQMNTLINSRIPHLLHVGNRTGAVFCESDYLPFSESCIDLICLPHVLEFSENPHQTLREAVRVLVPEGHLILTGFNPISAWGLKYALNQEDSYPWNGQFFTLSRIKDWLALLGLEFVSGEMHCYEPPINNQKWLNPATKVYCTHEYTASNIAFALTLEPDNETLIARQAIVKQLRRQQLPSIPSTIALEIKINPFFRCNQTTIWQNSQAKSRDELAVFTAIRTLRNHY